MNSQGCQILHDHYTQGQLVRDELSPASKISPIGYDALLGYKEPNVSSEGGTLQGHTLTDL